MTHTAPSTMAREAYPAPVTPSPDTMELVALRRMACATGIAAERARVAAWLQAEAKTARDADPRAVEAVTLLRLAVDLSATLRP